MTFNFFHDHWRAAVQDYLDGKPLIEVHTVQSFVDMVDLLPPGRQSILLIDKQGKQLTDRAVTSLCFEGGKGVVLPVDMHIVHEAAPDGDCLTLSKLIVQAWEAMILVARSRGTFASDLIDMDRTSMAHRWPQLKPLSTAPRKDLSIPWLLGLPRQCTSSSLYTILLLTVLPVGAPSLH